MSEAITKTQEDKTVFGFWIYLMTDCVLFASLFATFIVLRGNTFGGPAGNEIFSMPYVLVETLLLLISSFTCGLGLLAAYRKDKSQTLLWFGATFLLGLAFLGMEINEFSNLVSEGHSWRTSAFLSAFFTLVGTHGLHISIGLGWIAFLMARIRSQGITKINLKRLTLLSLFWHFLDIVWIFIFTIVFLVGEL
ncbi:cytochrome o ubiquinol oxidase subunit III [Candidatus Saccharibacteria bacterium]|nr:cytochrome o ubiquinol oxidase subunit III [Candidatus Saccharibacteria bacterium]